MEVLGIAACSRPAPPCASMATRWSPRATWTWSPRPARLRQRRGHAGHGLHARARAVKLFRFTEQIVFSFDGDAAGRRAARKALEAALPWPPTRAAPVPSSCRPEHDPDSFIRAEGSDAFADAVKGAVPLSRFFAGSRGRRLRHGDGGGPVALAANARPLWQLLPPGTLAQQLLGEIAAAADSVRASWSGCGYPLARHAEAK